MRKNSQQNKTEKTSLPSQSSPDVLKFNIFDSITDKIIAIIEAGDAKGGISWAGQGAKSGIPVNLLTKNAYSGINVLILWGEAAAKGYRSNYWLTFKQAVDMGGNVMMRIPRQSGHTFHVKLDSRSVATRG